MDQNVIQSMQSMAELARLELTSAEIKQLQADIKNILEYVELLNEASVSNVEPLMHPFEGLQNSKTPDRPDSLAQDSNNAQKVLACAPDVLQDGYKVPPIL